MATDLAFRLPHQIEKNVDNVIDRSGTSTYKLQISHLSWFVPIVTPELITMAKLQTYLASGATVPYIVSSYNVYRTNIRDDENV